MFTSKKTPARIVYVSGFVFVVVFIDSMKFSIIIFLNSATKSVLNGCGSFCTTNPKGAKWIVVTGTRIASATTPLQYFPGS
jgi:hypothetical protein